MILCTNFDYRCASTWWGYWLYSESITTKGINQEYETFACKYCGTTIKIELEEITADCDICGNRNMKSNNQWVRLEEHIDNYTQNELGSSDDSDSLDDINSVFEVGREYVSRFFSSKDQHVGSTKECFEL